MYFSVRCLAFSANSLKQIFLDSNVNTMWTQRACNCERSLIILLINCSIVPSNMKSAAWFNVSKLNTMCLSNCSVKAYLNCVYVYIYWCAVSSCFLASWNLEYYSSLLIFIIRSSVGQCRHYYLTVKGYDWVHRSRFSYKSSWKILLSTMIVLFVCKKCLLCQLTNKFFQGWHWMHDADHPKTITLGIIRSSFVEIRRESGITHF